jgi:hypothetical protein
VNGNWSALPITYGPAKHVPGVDGKQNVWQFQNRFHDQPLRLSVEARPALAGYGDSANIALLEPGPLNLRTDGAGPMGSPAHQADGLEFRLQVSPEGRPGSEKSLEVSAVNKGSVPAGWGCAEIVLDGAKDLRRHRALGTWVKGDGSGTYLHFAIEDSSRWQVRDYYVRLDFRGWKYVEMAEPAQGEIYDFAFPLSGYWSIRNIKFAEITRVYVFLTNVPAGGAATASFSRLEALRETPSAVRNPAVKVNGASITFPVQLEADWYLEYSGRGNARVFDANGFTKAELPPAGKTPLLRKGGNQVTFTCDRGKDLGESARVTLVTRGLPLR